MERNIISFSANQQELIKTGGISHYASNVVGYIVAEFDLGENWTEFDSVRAVFKSDYETVPAVLSHGACVIPFEVLKRRSTVKVNLVGSVAESNVLVDRLTSYPITALVVDANATVDNDIEPITPTEFEQFVAAVKADADRAEAGAESAEAAVEDAEASEQAALGSAQAAAASALNAANSASDASNYADRVAQMVAEVIAEIEEFEGVTVTVETLPAGSQATASFADGVLHLGIPRGDKGEQGDRGERGETGATGATGATGNGIESITLTSTSGAVKTYTILFTDGTSTTFEVTDGEVTQAVLDETVSDLKADISDNGVVAGSHGLVSDSKISDSVPYLFRQTADGTRVGNVLYEEIVGGTVAFNQLAKTSSSEANVWDPSDNGKGNTVDGGIKITPTGYSKTYALASPTGGGNTKSQVYFVHYKVSAISANVTYSGIKPNYSSLSAGVYTIQGTGTKDYIVKPSDTIYFQAGFSCGANNVTANDYVTFSEYIIHDLTAMLGTTIADYIYSLEQATAGAGVAWFKKLFPKPYYAYNAGELKSVEGLTSHDCVGFNQFDESTYTTYIDISRLIVGQTYCISAQDSSKINQYKISQTAGETSVWSSTSFAGATFTMTQSRANIGKLFVINKSWAESTASEIASAKVCINISSDRNGQYEPYVKRTYALDSAKTYRGIFKLDGNGNIYADGDIYKSIGQIDRRYDIVDLGTLEWTSGTDSIGTYFRAHVVGIKPTNGYVAGNLICAKYVTTASNNVNDKQIAVNASSGDTIYVRDTAYSDAPTFKAAMSGVYLVYEKATPTTETAEPYTSPQIVDRYGTEEYVTTGIVPIGHNSKYSEDLKGKIESLPWDFSTLIAPTETAYKATRNYTTGGLLIVNNILYKVTANIANGGNIVPNTNVVSTTLAEVISALA